MNNKRGYTLIEVVLSLAILGIISIGFLTIAGSNFSFFNRAKEISQTVFETQQEIELFIDKVKEGIRQARQEGENLTVGDQIDIEGIDLTFRETNFIWKDLDTSRNPKGAKIKYFEVEKNYNDKIYATLISDNRLEIDDEPLILHTIGIQAKKVSNNIPYAYGTNNEEFSIIGNFENDRDVNAKYNHLLNVVEWYTTGREFNMPVPDGIVLDEDSYYYPVFPRDYILVENETIDRYGLHESIPLPDLKPYKGKHIIFTVTPGAKSGKIGIQSASRPIFVSELPVTNSLAIHLDASFIGSNIDSHNSTNEIETKEENNETNTYVIRWNDIFSNYSSSDFSRAATPTNLNNKPLLLRTGIEETFIGQFVRPHNSNSKLRINDQGSGNKYIFAAARNNTENLENPSAITFITISGTNQEIEVPVVYGTDRVGEWVIIKKSINKARNNNFEIGGLDADVAEIAVYDSTLSNGEIKEIENYFLSKYRTNVLVDNGNIHIIDIESEN